MATARASTIIGGKKVDPYHVSIQQRWDWHHRFEISVSSEKVESPNSFSIRNSIAYVGKIAEISFNCAGNELRFKGIITKIHIDRSYAGDNLIVFAGFSPSYLMEDGLATKSFEEKNLANIVKELTGQYPTNLMNTTVSPKYTEVIPYLVQYKETNYQFISRLAATYGEWFFYDGQAMIFGELPNSESIELVFGKDLESFDYGINIKATSSNYQAYNYAENRSLDYATSRFKPSWLDDYGKKGHDAANRIFPNEHLYPVSYDIKDDDTIEHLAKASKSSKLSDTSFFNGSSSNAGITIGTRIGAAGKSTHIGRFRVTSVTHQLNANKDYYNNFTAIPLTVSAPPINANVYKPAAEPQVAVVKDNNDPDGLGRIRVQFKWQSGEEKTPWIRQLTNHASGDRGIYFVPELEDEVLIAFKQANPDRPYMKGSLYHSNTKPEYFDPDNNYKTIKTRSGHTFKLDDTEGKENITINDKNGNVIILNTSEESITISAPKKIVIESEEIEMNGKNITISASNELKEKGNNVSIGAKNNLKLSGDMAAELVSNQTVDVSGKMSVKVVSDVDTEVGGNATLKLKSTGMASIQGALVKIN